MQRKNNCKELFHIIGQKQALEHKQPKLVVG